MSTRRRTRALVGIACALALVACDSGATPSDAPADPPFLLQARVVAALPPAQLFDQLPRVTITRDLVVVTEAPVEADFPGPLLATLRGRSITASGFDRIVAEAIASGLLDRAAGPGQGGAGAATAEIDIWIDGAVHTMRGEPNAVMQCIRAPCGAPPGTAEAFGGFWTAVTDLGSFMPDELGPDAAYEPAAFGLLVDVEHQDGGGVVPDVLQWPLAMPLDEFGTPTRKLERPRCGTVTGEDANLLRGLLAQANQLTIWADPARPADPPVAIRARPLLPGDDVCWNVFGLGS